MFNIAQCLQANESSRSAVATNSTTETLTTRPPSFRSGSLDLRMRSPTSSFSRPPGSLDPSPTSPYSCPSGSFDLSPTGPFSPSSRYSEDNLSIDSSASAKVKRKFKLPEYWRPSVQACIDAATEEEQRRMLTPEIRIFLVRDVVMTMYAHDPKPKKAFCTEVAQRIVKHYPFMTDKGHNVSGHVSFFILISRPSPKEMCGEYGVDGM